MSEPARAETGEAIVDGSTATTDAQHRRSDSSGPRWCCAQEAARIAGIADPGGADRASDARVRRNLGPDGPLEQSVLADESILRGRRSSLARDRGSVATV